MLEPTEIPDDLHELEEELSLPPTAELSQELRARVMESVHETLEPRHLLSSNRSWMVISAASVAAAVMLIVMLFQSDRVTPTKPKKVVEVPIVNEEGTSLNYSHSPSLPTMQDFRLALIESPADWEASLHRQTDLFEELSAEAQTISWRQSASWLRNEFD